MKHSAIPHQFEWDDNKNRSNIKKHGIAFSIAVKIFENVYYACPSPQRTARGIEMRYVAVGAVEERIIAVIYTLRHETIRIISARSARKKEKVAYRALHGGHASRTH